MNLKLRIVSALVRPGVSVFFDHREKMLASRGFIRKYHWFRCERMLSRAGAYIPAEAYFATIPTFPHGLAGVFISQGAKIGANCTIFHQVTIGSNTAVGTKKPGSPTIGDNVYIGAGAKIIGGITIGDNVRVGANCVVTSDVPANATIVAGTPRVIEHDVPQDNHYTPFSDFK